jgi:hypothetical protein
MSLFNARTILKGLKDIIIRKATPRSLVDFLLHLEEDTVSEVSCLLLVTACLAYVTILKMVTALSSETSVNLCSTTWCHLL